MWTHDVPLLLNRHSYRGLTHSRHRPSSGSRRSLRPGTTPFKRFAQHALQTSAENSESRELTTTEDDEVGFNSGSDYVEWDRSSYERKKLSSRKIKSAKIRPTCFENSKRQRQAKSTAVHRHSQDSDAKSLSSCWKRADLCVEKFLKAQDAAYSRNTNVPALVLKEKVSKRSFFYKAEAQQRRIHGAITGTVNYTNSSRTSGDSSDNCERDAALSKKHSSREDTEKHKHMNETETAESITRNQIYRGIYEDSKVRAKKSERSHEYSKSKLNQMRNLQDMSDSTIRTERWVKQFGQPYAFPTEKCGEKNPLQSDQQHADIQNGYEAVQQQQFDDISQTHSMEECDPVYQEPELCEHCEFRQPQIKTSEKSDKWPGGISDRTINRNSENIASNDSYYILETYDDCQAYKEETESNDYYYIGGERAQRRTRRSQASSDYLEHQSTRRQSVAAAIVVPKRSHRAKSYQDRSNSPINIKMLRSQRTVKVCEDAFSEQQELAYVEIKPMIVKLDSVSTTASESDMERARNLSESEPEVPTIKLTDEFYEDKLIDTIEQDEKIVAHNILGLNIYDADDALLEMPDNFEGYAVILDDDVDLLDISLSDDEEMIKAKLTEAVQRSGTKDPAQDLSYTTLIDECESLAGYTPTKVFNRRSEVVEAELIGGANRDSPDENCASNLAERTLRSYYEKAAKSFEQKKREPIPATFSPRTGITDDSKTAALVKQFRSKLNRTLRNLQQSFQKTL